MARAVAIVNVPTDRRMLLRQSVDRRASCEFSSSFISFSIRRTGPSGRSASVPRPITATGSASGPAFLASFAWARIAMRSFSIASSRPTSSCCRGLSAVIARSA